MSTHTTATTEIPITRTITSWEDHRDVVDTLYRFAAGQDLRDRPLFESAFAADAVVDFVQPASRFGVALAPFQGREAIVNIIMTTTAPLYTTHTVTNPRVQVRGDRATLTALVEAQHVRRDAPRRHLLLKNLYRVELTRASGEWLIAHLHIENVWHEGEPAVLFQG